jgi:hypothetical protein
VEYRSIANKIPYEFTLAEVDAAFADLQVDVLDEQQFTLVQRVIDRVSDCTDFFVAPASAKFHLNEPGGLYRHSLGVTARLFALDEAYDLSDYTSHELFLCGLLHDLGKAGQVTLARSYKEDSSDNSASVITVDGRGYHSSCKEYYVKEALKTKPGEFEYTRNPERVAMSIPVSSLYFIGTVLSDLWKPSVAAWQAIGYHDGQYVPEGKHVAHGETKLGLALHHADMWQCRTEAGWGTGSFSS